MKKKSLGEENKKNQYKMWPQALAASFCFHGEMCIKQKITQFNTWWNQGELLSLIMKVSEEIKLSWNSTLWLVFRYFIKKMTAGLAWQNRTCILLSTWWKCFHGKCLWIVQKKHLPQIIEYVCNLEPWNKYAILVSGVPARSHLSSPPFPSRLSPQQATDF